MLPPLATLEELLARADVDDETRAEAVLDDASAIIRDEAGKDWVDDLDALAGVPDVIVTLTLKVTKRALENPDGLSGETYPEYAWRKDGAEDGVYLTESECKIARRSGGKSGLWTQATTKRSQRSDGDTVWVEDQFGCEPFPMYVDDC